MNGATRENNSLLVLTLRRYCALVFPSIGSNVHFPVRARTIEIEDGWGGITWDGNFFWVPRGGRGICKIDKDGIIVGEIYAASEGTWDLAWDGHYLWATQGTNENLVGCEVISN